MQNENLSIARHVEAAIVFLRDGSHFSQKCVNIAPFKIVRYRVLENPIESSLMRAGELSGCFHNSEGQWQSRGSDEGSTPHD